MYKYLFIPLLFVPPILVCSNSYSLNSMEQKSISMAKEWMNNNTKIIKQNDGSLAFKYGDNMPSLICRPYNATIIKLEKGEKIEGIRSGDPTRWKFDKIERERPSILVKPNKANIMTNLIIFTDRRIYNIKLVATSKSWLPGISFIYDKSDTHANHSVTTSKSEDIEIPILETRLKSKKSKKIKHKKVKKSKLQYITVSDSTWQPKNVFNKHGKTYITIGNWNINKLPRLYILDGKSSTFRYTYKNNQLVVNGIINKAILVKDGFGKTIIKIRRKK